MHYHTRIQIFTSSYIYILRLLKSPWKAKRPFAVFHFISQYGLFTVGVHHGQCLYSFQTQQRCVPYLITTCDIIYLNIPVQLKKIIDVIDRMSKFKFKLFCHLTSNLLWTMSHGKFFICQHTKSHQQQNELCWPAQLFSQWMQHSLFQTLLHNHDNSHLLPKSSRVSTL